MSERKPAASFYGIPSTVAHWLIPLAGLTATLVVSYHLYGAETGAIANRFRAETIQRTASLDREISLVFETLFTLRALVSAHADVPEEGFIELAEQIRHRHPAIQALEWVPRVPNAQRQQHEKARRASFPSYQILQRDERGEMAPADERAVYFPVSFVEPVTDNEAAVGFDLASNRQRREALELARDTALPRATARITLVQEKGDHPGFLCFLPVYEGRPTSIIHRRASLRGFVLGVFRIADIFEGSIGGDDLAGIHMVLLDASDTDTAEPLHVLGDQSSPPEAIGRFVLHRTLDDVAGRRWTLVAWPDDDYVSSHRTAAPWALLLLGSLTTLLLGIYSLSIDRRSEMVEEQVEQRTAELEAALETVNQLSGLLPICSGCKSIRDDDGDWSPFETYIGERSEADFTHSMCPSCVERYYSEFVRNASRS